MAANADIFEEREAWRRPLTISAVLHVALFGSIFFYAAFFAGRSGGSWGNSGDGTGNAMSATLVTTVPLPANPQAKPENVLANESKGVTQSVPKPEEKDKTAIPIPDRNAKTKIKPSKQPPVTPTHEQPREVAKVSNVVPFGQGGPVSGPYGTFSAAGAKGGFGFNGAGGDFGTRFGWYVDAVRRKVSENWMKYEIDPSLSTTRRVYIYFEITRPGAPANIRIEQSSGIPSLDQSALRALQRIDTFGPLPPEYSGNRVAVEFWFDPPVRGQ
ncbi:MAG: TonB family protein [Candidatus Korobacteraceae bacterium]|jgi:protein TonB